MRAVRGVVVLAVVLAATPARADRADLWLFGAGAGVGGGVVDEPMVVVPVHLGLERLRLTSDADTPGSIRGRSLSFRGELLVGGGLLITGGSVQYERLGWMGAAGKARSWGGRAGLYAAPVPGEGTLTYLGAWAVWRYRDGIMNLALSAGLAAKVAGQLETESGQYNPDGSPIMEIDQGPPVVFLVSAEISVYAAFKATLTKD